MTLLTIAQNAANEIGVAKPSTIVGNNDPDARQLLRAANRTGRALVKRHSWETLTKEGSFTSAATESQGAMTTIASDYERFVGDSMWNRTKQWKIFGPLTPQSWQRLNAFSSSGVRNWFRIRGGNLIVFPTMTAGESVFFEYISEDWVDTDGDGVMDAVAYAADTDTCAFDEDIVEMGVTWRFLEIKGLPYQEAKAEYEKRVMTEIMQDGAKGVLDMTGSVMEGWPANLPENGFGS